MHISTFTFLTLTAATSSAAATNTYIKTSAGDHFLGYAEGDGVRTMNGYYIFDRIKDQGVSVGGIKNDTTLAGGFSFAGCDEPLDDDAGSCSSYFVPGFTPKPSAGFSWSSNGTLQFSYEPFYGWIICPEADSGSNILWWATKPFNSSELTDSCEKVDLVKYVH